MAETLPSQLQTSLGQHCKLKLCWRRLGRIKAFQKPPPRENTRGTTVRHWSLQPRGPKRRPLARGTTVRHLRLRCARAGRAAKRRGTVARSSREDFKRPSRRSWGDHCPAPAALSTCRAEAAETKGADSADTKGAHRRRSERRPPAQTWMQRPRGAPKQDPEWVTHPRGAQRPKSATALWGRARPHPNSHAPTPIGAEGTDPIRTPTREPPLGLKQRRPPNQGKV